MSNADGTAGLAAAVARLEREVREVTDRLELQQLVASYGPAVDSCAEEGRPAGDLWLADGTYDTDINPMDSADAVRAMVVSPRHGALVDRGCGHVLGPAHVVLDGDRAVVTCYSMVVARDTDSDRFWVWRVSANRWECVRTDDGWKVERRVNRALDGREEARALLAPAAGVRRLTAAREA